MAINLKKEFPKGETVISENGGCCMDDGTNLLNGCNGDDRGGVGMGLRMEKIAIYNSVLACVVYFPMIFFLQLAFLDRSLMSVLKYGTITSGLLFVVFLIFVCRRIPKHLWIVAVVGLLIPWEYLWIPVRHWDVYFEESIGILIIMGLVFWVTPIAIVVIRYFQLRGCVDSGNEELIYLRGTLMGFCIAVISLLGLWLIYLLAFVIDLLFKNSWLSGFCYIIMFIEGMRMLIGAIQNLYFNRIKMFIWMGGLFVGCALLNVIFMITSYDGDNIELLGSVFPILYIVSVGIALVVNVIKSKMEHRGL